MDEPASALDPIATTRIEDLMHELKRDYTIVDRHAQHAAGRARRRHDGVLQRRARGRGAARRGSSSSTTRRRRSSRSRPTSEPRTTSPAGSDERLARHVPARAGGLQANLHEESELVLRSLRGALNALASSRRRARRRGDRVRRRGRRASTWRSGRESSSCSRARRRSRAISDSCSPCCTQPPPRADGRPLRDDRQADEARARS